MKSRNKCVEFPGVKVDIAIYDDINSAVISMEQNGRVVILTGGEILKLAQEMPNPYLQSREVAAIS